MEKEKHKKGIGEEAKNGFISCFTSLLILISSSVGVLLLVGAVIDMNFQAQARDAIAEIQPVVRKLCNLPDYEAQSQYLDSWEGYYSHRLERENLEIFCISTSSWECSCDKASNE